MSPPPTPSQMTLRSKYKKRRLDGEQSVTNQTIDLGASYLKYELIKRKSGKFLVPVRYSIRNSERPDPNEQLKQQIMNNEISFMYEPNEMENLFEMDEANQEIKQTIQQKYFELEKSDIMEVLDADVKSKGNFSIVKIKPECRDKYGGHEQIATALRRLSSSPGKRAAYMHEMLDHMVKGNHMNGELMLTEATKEAVDFIKKSSRRRK